ncbi:MAG TPA: hypothetical protein VFU71_03365 [Burkholderiaceae bacterium]|nr:hypothetical protein [Burkholderiaceae bacterium]
MVDRLRELDKLGEADRRIARAEALIARLSKSILSLDPASEAAAIGWRSLKLMYATLVQFRATREQIRQLLIGDEPTPEAENAIAAEQEHIAAGTRPPAPLDQQQEEVLRALLKLEVCADSPGEFDALWLVALQNDFRPEKDADGPLRTALKL